MSVYYVEKTPGDPTECAQAPPVQPEYPWQERCNDCPYPHDGFLCWSKDGSCLRDAVKKIDRKEVEDL